MKILHKYRRDVIFENKSINYLKFYCDKNIVKVFLNV